MDLTRSEYVNDESQLVVSRAQLAYSCPKL